MLWLTENYPPQKGGMAQSCDRIIYNLRKVGFQIHVIHFTNRGKPFEIYQEEGGSYVALPVYEDESHTLHIAYNFIKSRQLSMDIMVVFGGYLSMLAGPVYKAWFQCKMILMVRGNDFDAAIFSPRKRKILEDALRTATITTCVSQQKRDQIKLLFPENECIYIPNGIDCTHWEITQNDRSYNPDWKKTNGRKLILGCFGHLKEKKGVDLLIDAFQSPGLRESFMLLLIGETEQQNIDTLTGMNVTFEHFPFMERLALIKYYLICDALIIPSHYDGMPNTLLEAGALGIPVIASDRDGMHDVLYDIKGLLFSPGNSVDLRKALFEFKKLSDEERKQSGLDLKRNILERFNTMNETKAYEHLFKSL